MLSILETRCYSRLANLPNFALDRLSRNEITLGAKLVRSCLHSMGWIAANHKREGAGSRSVADQTFRPTDATTAELSDCTLYAIETELRPDGRTSLQVPHSRLHLTANGGRERGSFG
jgi:hypothetical protein